MKIDFTQKLLAVDGTELDGGKMTLALVTINSVMAPAVAEQGRPALTGEEMVRRYVLGQRIVAATEPIEVSPEDVAFIRQRIAEVYQNPVVVGPAWKALEG